MSAAVLSAVPLGASALRSWCISTISTEGMNRAACSEKRIMSTAPIAKFGATNRHVPSGASATSSSQRTVGQTGGADDAVDSRRERDAQVVGDDRGVREVHHDVR